MSWDVWLETELDGHEIQVTEGINYTHNCNGMIRDAGFDAWPHGVDGWDAGRLAKQLDATIVILEMYPVMYRKMNPENGWGDYDSMLGALRKVRDDCRTYPSAKVRMWA